MQIAEAIYAGNAQAQGDRAQMSQALQGVASTHLSKQQLEMEESSLAESQRRNLATEADAATGRELQASGQVLEGRRVSTAEKALKMEEQNIIDTQAKSFLTWWSAMNDNIAQAQSGAKEGGNVIHVASQERRRTEKLLEVMRDSNMLPVLAKSTLMNPERGKQLVEDAVKAATPKEKEEVLGRVRDLAKLISAGQKDKVAPEQQAFLNSKYSSLGQREGLEMGNQLYGEKDPPKEEPVTNPVSDVYAASLDTASRRLYEARKQSGITQAELDSSTELMTTFFQDITAGDLKTADAGGIAEAMEALMDTEFFDVRNPNRTVLADIYNTFKEDYAGMGNNKKAIAKLKKSLEVNFGLKIMPNKTINMPGGE